jgi:RNA polymerase sigma factor (sigma-70 family)
MEACQLFEEHFGVPKELFVRQRVWNALKDFWRLEWAMQQIVSLDETPQGEEGDRQDWQEQIADEEVAQTIDRCLVRDLVARLPERERLIIERLFWDGDNLTSIAKDLRVSIPRVHQLKEQAIARLREWMGKERPTR